MVRAESDSSPAAPETRSIAVPAPEAVSESEAASASTRDSASAMPVAASSMLSLTWLAVTSVPSSSPWSASASVTSSRRCQ